MLLLRFFASTPVFCMCVFCWLLVAAFGVFYFYFSLTRRFFDVSHMLRLIADFLSRLLFVFSIFCTLAAIVHLAAFFSGSAAWPVLLTDSCVADGFTLPPAAPSPPPKTKQEGDTIRKKNYYIWKHRN